MKRLVIVCISGYAALLSAQRVAPPPRPVMEVRLLLARFNNGTAGFSAGELSGRAIGFAQDARAGEFALAYCEDRGDNMAHLPLHLAISRSGQPWRRATIDTPADKLGSVSGIILGVDYLLVATATPATPSQHLLVFDKTLALKHTTDGWLELDPLPNGIAVIHPSPDHDAPTVRSTLSTFDLHTGMVAPLYPVGKQGQPSAAYQKQLPDFVGRLNALLPNGNLGRGYKVEWSASVRQKRAEHDARTDRLTFTQVIAPTWPIPPVAGLHLSIESMSVSCGPMLKPNPTCVEGTRTIGAWPPK